MFRILCLGLLLALGTARAALDPTLPPPGLGPALEADAVIEPTVEQMGEMVTAFWAAHDDPEDGGTERGLTAVLALVERD
ncbi:MAG: hypothetical protein V4812_23145, partial [Pseudomonadota bacterium]